VENQRSPKSLKTITNINLFAIAKSRCQTLIKPVAYEDFWMHFAKSNKNQCKKHYVSHCFLLRFRELENDDFPLKGMYFEDVQKRKRKSL